MTTITITKGTDANINFTITDGAGEAISVTSVEIMSNSGALNGKLSVVETDLSAGEFSVRLEGSDPLPIGRHWFRWQAVLASGDTLGGPEVFINVT